MKFFVVNRGDDTSAELAQRFRQQADAYGLAFDPKDPDIVLSIGGDGTMLQAIHQFADKLETTAFVGIHTGDLGFYTDWKPDEMDELLKRMVDTELASVIVEYPVAEMELITETETRTLWAMNEFTVKGMEATLVARVHINDEPFEMFRGDGIVISTPTGSTAYNKSLGGAIIHPSLPSIQIAEIASINNRVYRTLGSSMILPKHHYCDIYPQPGRKLLLFVDHLQYAHDKIKSMRFRVSDRTVRFARYRPFPFWNRVKEAFINEFEA